MSNIPAAPLAKLCKFPGPLSCIGQADVINGCRHLLQKEWKDSLLQKARAIKIHRLHDVQRQPTGFAKID